MVAKIFWGILFLLCLALAVKMSCDIKKLKSTHDDLKKESRLYMQRENILLYNGLLQFVYNSSEVADCVLSDADGNQYMLSELVDTKPKLIIRISSLHCSSCVAHLLDELKKKIDLILEGRVLMIGAFENKRVFQAFKKTNGINVPFYYVNVYNEQENALGKENLPCLYLLDERMKIENLFIPIKELPDYTGKYFDIMTSRFLMADI